MRPGSIFRSGFLMILAFLLVLSSQVAGQTSSTPKAGGELRIALAAEAPGLDPHKEPSFSTIRMTELIYETLVRLDDRMNVVPGLAESWEIPDPQTYIFHLRKGVKFHNGREFTSDDVKYSIERILNPDTGALARNYFQSIKSIEPVDKYTVRFLLKEPFAPFLTNLASYYAMIVPKEVVEKHGGLQRVAVGTGPFKLGERLPDNYTKLERNPDYYIRGLPYLNRITFFIMTDEASRIAALRTGQVDFAALTAKAVQLLKNDRSLKIEKSPGLGYEYLGFNCSKAPFNDPRVRQAISYAVNREEIIEASIWGEGTMTGPVPPALQTWAVAVGEFPSYKTNTKRAKELLAQAGYPSGFKSMIKAGTQQQVDEALIIQSQLKEIGIDTDIVQVEWGTYVADWRASNFDMLVGGNQGRADPDEYLFLHFHSKGAANVWKFVDSDVDRLIETGRTTVNARDRAKIYLDLQKLVVERSPILFLYSADLFVGLSSKVHGFKLIPNAQCTYLRETWIEH